MISTLASFLWQMGCAKYSREYVIEQLKLKKEYLDYKSDALKEEITKDLVRGKMPTKESRTWLHKVEEIKLQVDDLVKSTPAGSATSWGARLMKLLSLVQMPSSPSLRVTNSPIGRKRKFDKRRSKRNNPVVVVFFTMNQPELKMMNAQEKIVRYLEVSPVELPSTGIESKAFHRVKDAPRMKSRRKVESKVYRPVKEAQRFRYSQAKAEKKARLKFEMTKSKAMAEAESATSKASMTAVVAEFAEEKSETSTGRLSMLEVDTLMGVPRKTTEIVEVGDQPKLGPSAKSTLQGPPFIYESGPSKEAPLKPQMVSSSRDEVDVYPSSGKDLAPSATEGRPVSSEPILNTKKSIQHMVQTPNLPELFDVLADRATEAKGLPSEEAWQLFCKQLGEIINLSDVQVYAQHIVEQCHGLPLLVAVTGRALREEGDIEVWKSAFKHFLLPKKAGMHDMKPIIHKFKFSYDRLKEHGMKNLGLEGCDLQGCFLYCALFAQGHKVNILKVVESWIEEGLIAGNVAEAQKKAGEVVNILIDAALIESDESGLCIKMHDVIRDFALNMLLLEVEAGQFLVRADSRLAQPANLGGSSLSGPLDGYLLRAGAGLTEAPPAEEWKKSKMIFLMDNELSNLPERPNCPDLSMLFLQRNHHLRVIHESFFDCMHSLKVVNLSKTRISALPKSVTKLKNLEKLVLRDCKRLVELPAGIGKLEHLQVLDLNGTEIDKLPIETGELASLRHMEVSFYGSSEHMEYLELPSAFFPDKFISKLSDLRILRIAVYPGDPRWIKIAEAVIMDVSNLRNIIDLCFYFPKIELLHLFLDNSSVWTTNYLKKFNFVVGQDIKRMIPRVPHNVEFEYNQGGQCLRFVNGETVPEAVKEVLTRTTAFYLDHHLTIHSLSEFGVRNMIGLEFCVVRECPKIETIADSEELTFPFLEHLSIHYLGSLKSIWHGLTPAGSFTSLKYLGVHQSPKLKSICTSSTSQFISNLEALVVEDCQLISEIIEQNTSVKSGHVLLPRLKSLTLHYLPNLVNLWVGWSWPSLEHISFYHCPKLKNLHMSPESELKRSIKKIEAENRWWDALEWNDNSLPAELKAVFIPFPEENL